MLLWLLGWPKLGVEGGGSTDNYCMKSCSQWWWLQRRWWEVVWFWMYFDVFWIYRSGSVHLSVDWTYGLRDGEESVMTPTFWPEQRKERIAVFWDGEMHEGKIWFWVNYIRDVYHKYNLGSRFISWATWNHPFFPIKMAILYCSAFWVVSTFWSH